MDEFLVPALYPHAPRLSSSCARVPPKRGWLAPIVALPVSVSFSLARGCVEWSAVDEDVSILEWLATNREALGGSIPGIVS